MSPTMHPQVQAQQQPIRRLKHVCSAVLRPRGHWHSPGKRHNRSLPQETYKLRRPWRLHLRVLRCGFPYRYSRYTNIHTCRINLLILRTIRNIIIGRRMRRQAFWRYSANFRAIGVTSQIRCRRSFACPRPNNMIVWKKIRPTGQKNTRGIICKAATKMLPQTVSGTH